MRKNNQLIILKVKLIVLINLREKIKTKMKLKINNNFVNKLIKWRMNTHQLIIYLQKYKAIKFSILNKKTFRIHFKIIIIKQLQ